MALMLLPKVGLASLSAISAGDAYDEALEKTSDQSKANLAGVLNFLWTAFTEKLPFDELAKTGGGIKKALRVGGAEAFQEVTEHIGSHAIAKNVFDPERPDIKGEELLESAVGGFGGGFMSGGVRGFTDKGKTKWTELSKEKTKIQEQEVQPEEVQEKEARKKSPEQIRAEATEKRSKAKIEKAQKKIQQVEEMREYASKKQKGKLTEQQTKDFDEQIELQEEKIQQYLREEEVTREDIRKAEDKYLYKNVYSDIKEFGKISTKNVPRDLSTKAKN